MGRSDVAHTCERDRCEVMIKIGYLLLVSVVGLMFSQPLAPVTIRPQEPASSRRVRRPQKPSHTHPYSARIRGKIYVGVPPSGKEGFGEADEEDYFCRCSSLSVRTDLVRRCPSSKRSALAAMAWTVLQRHGPRRCADDLERHE